MRKLRLNLADLHVDSFHTRVPAEARGTVVGRMPPPVTLYDPTCGFFTCDVGAYSCHYQTCYSCGSCDPYTQGPPVRDGVRPGPRFA
jgi:hypothetical protein